MADQNRTFILVGKFQDEITPSLKKINEEVSKLQTSFSSLNSNFSKVTKSLKSLTESVNSSTKAFQAQKSSIDSSYRSMMTYAEGVGKAIKANIALKNSISGESFQKQRNGIESVIRAMGMYRDATGRVVSSNKALESNVNGQPFMAQRNGVESIIRAMMAYRNEAGKVIRANKAVSTSSTLGIPASPRARGIPEESGFGPRNFSGLTREPSNPFAIAGAAVFGNIIGQTVASHISQAIIMGFNAGTAIMKKTLIFGANAIKERISDEMSDIQSAGGMYSIDRATGTKIFKNFEDARDFQESLNAKLAKSAGALPGATADYVQNAKQLTDTMMTAFSKDREGFLKLGMSLGSRNDARDALSSVINEFTSKSVMLGLGGDSNSRYGVPQVLEMLANQQQVNLQSLNRFSSYFQNPLLKGALERNLTALRGTAAGTAARIKVILKALNEAVPAEVVQHYKMSASGLIEAMRSSFFDPDTGILGLGRKLKLAVPKMNAFGQFVDNLGRVVKTAAEAGKKDISIFELLKDALGGFFYPISEIVSNLPSIFDPLMSIGESLKEFRLIGQRFLRNYMAFTKGFEDLSKIQGFQALAPTKMFRGAILAIEQLLYDYGAVAREDFIAVRDLLKNPNADFGKIIKEQFEKLMSSDFMEQLGKYVGSFFGTIISTIANIISGAKSLSETSGLLKGLSEGFNAAGGVEGIKVIYKSIFELIGKTLLEGFRVAPVETSLALGFGTGAIPAAIGGLATLLPNLVITLGPLITVLGTLAYVVDNIGGSFQNWQLQLSEVFSEISSAFGGITTALNDFASIFSSTEDSVNGVGDSFDALKFILTPIVAGMQLLETALRSLTLITNFAQLGQAKFIGWLMNLPGINMIPGAKELGAAANAKVPGLEKNVTRDAEGITSANKRHMEYYQNWDAYKRGASQANPIFTEPTSGTNLVPVMDKWGKKSDTHQNSLMGTLRDIASGVTQLVATALTPPAGAATLDTFGANSAFSGGGGGGEYTGKFAKEINAAAKANGIPASLLAGLIKTESNFNPKAVSGAGATGLGQLMPGTAAELGVTNPYDPAQSAMGAAKYLKKMLGFSGGNVTKALTSYNQGPYANAQGLPQSAEARAYAPKVLEAAKGFGYGSMTSGLSQGGLGKGMGAGGGLAGARQMAEQLGLPITSTTGGTHARKSLHYQGRAIDFGGDPAKLSQLAARLAQTSPTQLIWSGPGPQSMADGARVDPINYWGPETWAAHNNHVHIAYAGGPGMPAFFDSMSSARSWERKMAPSNAQIRSITANSSEKFGGTINNHNQITINQQPGQNAEQLATIVVDEITKAMNDARRTYVYI